MTRFAFRSLLLVGACALATVALTPPATAGSIDPCTDVESTVPDGSGDKVISFTSVGSCNWTVPADVTSVEYLIVGGGGGGGSRHGGGGGAGGVLTGTTPVTPGDVVPITVGAGGMGTPAHSNASYAGVTASDGSSSEAFSLEAFGGGHGRSPGGDATNGGSGGGSSVPAATSAPGTGVAGQGHDGAEGAAVSSAWSGGGGGGAGAAGNPGVAGTGGAGGAGMQSSITGTATYYGGGGGGGGTSLAVAVPGGAGGIGGGGTGIVIVRWSVASGGSGGSGGGERTDLGETGFDVASLGLLSLVLFGAGMLLLRSMTSSSVKTLR